jgi:hypothetical protein
VTRPRAKFDGLVADGTTAPYRQTRSFQRLEAFARVAGLASLTETRLQNGVDNIRSWYPKHDHLLAQVTLVNLDYHADTNKVTPGVSYRSRPSGAGAFARRQRSPPENCAACLPIYEERVRGSRLAGEGSRDLASYFQTQGYFDAAGRLQIATPPTASN